MKQFHQLAYTQESDFIFGRATKPVQVHENLTIGAGLVYPEINFTLPSMSITAESMPKVLSLYQTMLKGICQRAAELQVPALIAEVELLPPCTWNVAWGAQITARLKEILNDFSAKHNIPSALRTTVVDIREGRDLEKMHQGRQWENVLTAFRENARAGADLLAIESIGGKEVHDEGSLYGDLRKTVFALGVLGIDDMHRLWSEICRIADEEKVIASGDTACAFANTAMVLADKKFIPKVFAAVDRVVSAVRSLAAVEAGAIGPHKDCGYEGVYVKAITGIPISMEGRSSAVAHLSPVGNVAACVADLWSNESVQYIKLLGGDAPTVSMEQLAYDCRLFNQATKEGPKAARLLQKLHADSDSRLDPQAYVLRPDVVLDIARQIVADDAGPLSRCVTAARASIAAMRDGVKQDRLELSAKETDWLDRLADECDEIPLDAAALVAEMSDSSEVFDPKRYDLDG